MKGLYLVTPDWNDTHKLLKVTEQALLGGAALVQYRNKMANDYLRGQQATQLRNLCRRYRRPFIVNDHLDLANAARADGIHVGGKDAPVADMRHTLGEKKIVGASCYGSMDLAWDAYQGGASYLAFGGFYPSKVKRYPVTTEPGIVEQAKAEIGLPVVVIGGMTPENAAPLVARGADMVAAISSIYLASDPQAVARAFADLFRAG